MTSEQKLSLSKTVLDINNLSDNVSLGIHNIKDSITTLSCMLKDVEQEEYIELADSFLSATTTIDGMECEFNDIYILSNRLAELIDNE